MKKIISAAMFLVTIATFQVLVRPAHGDDTTIVRASGNPYLGDFLALSGKRANLRAAVSIKGLDTAFSEWLNANRPVEFEKYARIEREIAGTPTKKQATCPCCAQRPSTASDNPY